MAYTEEELKFAVKLQETLLQPHPLDEVEQVIDKSGAFRGTRSTALLDCDYRRLALDDRYVQRLNTVYLTFYY